MPMAGQLATLRGEKRSGGMATQSRYANQGGWAWITETQTYLPPSAVIAA